MAKTTFPKLGDDVPKSFAVDGADYEKRDDATQDNKEPARHPRTILTEGAIVPSGWVKKSATDPSDANMAHHVCSVGDTVMMTDEEFDRHQSAGVCVVNADEREAA